MRADGAAAAAGTAAAAGQQEGDPAKGGSGAPPPHPPPEALTAMRIASDELRQLAVAEMRTLPLSRIAPGTWVQTSFRRYMIGYTETRPSLRARLSVDYGLLERRVAYVPSMVRPRSDIVNLMVHLAAGKQQPSPIRHLVRRCLQLTTLHHDFDFSFANLYIGTHKGSCIWLPHLPYQARRHPLPLPALCTRSNQSNLPPNRKSLTLPLSTAAASNHLSYIG